MGEQSELERRRNLTDEQRRMEDEEFAKQRSDYGKEKEKWKFLQKYYHKGAYFQDEDETGNNKLGPVMHQDFGAATGKDSWMDKSALPEVMQVKNFGFRSQVKWTHLSKEDTTAKNEFGKAEALWGATPSSPRSTRRAWRAPRPPTTFRAQPASGESESGEQVRRTTGGARVGAVSGPRLYGVRVGPSHGS